MEISSLHYFNRYNLENDAKIEKEVLKLVGLNRKDYEVIIDTIKSCEQLIPFKRLLNIKAEDIYSK